MSLILDGTNGLSDVDGTAAAPAIRGTDANTGIFFPAADTIAFAEGGAEAMRIDSSGNVGIGTSSPAYKVDIGSVTDADLFRIRSTAAANNTVLRLGISGNNAVINASGDSTGTMQFNVYGSERMRIDSSGNLLVGTTTNPGGGAYQTVISQESYDGLYVSVNQSPGGHTIRANRLGDGDVIQIHRSGAQVGVISVASSSTSYTTSSDYRLKDSIAPMTGALAKVALLKPVTYKWKVDGSDGQGFIAHELAEVEAGCVTGEKDAVDAEGNPQYQGIDTSFLIATLSAAIQELHALVKTQDSTITALTTRITALEAA